MELTIELRPRPGKFQELYQTLQALLPTIRKEDVCRDCRVSSEVEDGEIFFLSIDWEALAGLERYMQSVSAMALLGAIDVLCETARVKIGHDAEWEGLNALKRLKKVLTNQTNGV